MANTKALKECIDDSGIPVAEIARRAGMLRETLYNRMSGKGEFKASEIMALASVLRMTKAQRDSIFFTN